MENRYLGIIFPFFFFFASGLICLRISKNFSERVSEGQFLQIACFLALNPFSHSLILLSTGGCLSELLYCRIMHL